MPRISRPRSLGTPSPAKAWSGSGRRWRCPACGKQFIRAGLSHSCGVVPLADHFRGRARARELFDALCAAIREVGGPFRLSVAKTRIGLITGITFGAVMPRARHLRAHIVLLRRVESKCFVRIDHFAPYWVHVFEIRDEADLDEPLRSWLGEAYQVGAGR